MVLLLEQQGFRIHEHHRRSPIRQQRPVEGWPLRGLGPKSKGELWIGYEISDER